MTIIVLYILTKLISRAIVYAVKKQEAREKASTSERVLRQGIIERETSREAHLGNQR